MGWTLTVGAIQDSVRWLTSSVKRKSNGERWSLANDYQSATNSSEVMCPEGRTKLGMSKTIGPKKQTEK